jgi:hypothetical protein
LINIFTRELTTVGFAGNSIVQTGQLSSVLWIDRVYLNQAPSDADGQCTMEGNSEHALWKAECRAVLHDGRKLDVALEAKEGDSTFLHAPPLNPSKPTTAPGAIADSLPALVQSEIKQAQSACGTEQPVLRPGFVTAEDINGDGVVDYVLDYSKFECGDALFYCGSAGCLTQVFVSLAGGQYVEVLDENVRGISFGQRNGRPAEIIDLHGSACGRVGAAPCSMILFWNGQTFSPAN